MKEIPSEKISKLRDLMLEKATDKKNTVLANARHEVEDWLMHETEKLQKETSLILTDAHKRAEDIRRRQILSAEREKVTETLRLQNRILSDAMGRFQDKLVRLREREDYPRILAGMCVDAVNSLKGSIGKLKFRLAAVDIPLADDISGIVKTACPGGDVVFDPDPAPILGGCWVSTDDNSIRVNSDWQSLTQEMADMLAERLLPLL